MWFAFVAQVAATLVMVGVIWFAQVVHYPLLGRVGDETFVEYQVLNMRRTGWVVAPWMLVESSTALLMLWRRPEGISLLQAWVGVGLLVLIWLSTAFLQIPRHNILARGFDRGAHRALVRTNWIRSVAWSARGLLVLWMLWRVMNVNTFHSPS